MPPNTTTVELDAGSLEKRFARADIEFHEVDHSGPSFEARVYLNNTDANADTPTDEKHGYAGRFNIFGHGGCFGEVGHCDVHPRRAFDPRPAHPLTKARKTVIATDAVGRAVRDGDRLTVTVVPIIRGVTAKSGQPDDVLQFERVRIVTYR